MDVTQTDEYAEAYVAIVDSQHVEPISGNVEVYKRRLAVVRSLLALGMTDGKAEANQ